LISPTSYVFDAGVTFPDIIVDLKGDRQDVTTAR
jgi:hypothetical protein